MNTLKTNQITANASMPIKSGTIDFLQDAWKEVARYMANSVGSNIHEIASSGSVLWGGENNGSAPNWDIRTGLVYYGGELYILDAATFTSGGGQTAVCTITTTYNTSATTDPVLFTDGNSHNAHEIKRMTVAAGVSGSGTVDYNSLTFINPAHNNKVQTGFHANWLGSALSYRRNANGLITLTGKLVAGASASYSDLICTLPTGWRPAADLIVSVSKFDGTTQLSALVTIKANGQVFIYHTNGGVTVNDNYYLDTVSFYKSF